MKPRISIIDYGLCNLYNVTNAFEYVGGDTEIIDSSKQVKDADYLILPGVGAFKDGMKGLENRNLINSIKEHVSKKKPFLGICLGMQMMLDVSFEFGEISGLGIIPGQVKKLPNKGSDNRAHKIPHIGWNNLEILNKEIQNKTILKTQDSFSSMYFIHSFSALCNNKKNLLAETNYNGISIASVIFDENSYGCQFHPEKSGEAGLKILKEFINL